MARRTDTELRVACCHVELEQLSDDSYEAYSCADNRLDVTIYVSLYSTAPAVGEGPCQDANRTLNPHWQGESE